MLSVRTSFAAIAISAMVMALGTSGANAWTRSGGGMGPRGGTWSTSASGGCAGGSCSRSHAGTYTGPRGGVVTNSGQTSCSGGTCTHTGTTTGPYGGTVSRSSTYTR
ncbi:Conserved hypothetical protein [Bradyrhizobium sp. ORS 285]|uniref:hypothetical protein n=2 Tax=Bradyrhizobium sp. ORS 285 TaxID=115808 RepID=UPI0002E9DA40|nr:hypothetical protein [Bradyrhizobium sp. ORS 285]SMX56171.1 Conserved hypothetical protein [Bradyrhizobium sp. ORS 285]